MKSDVLQNYLVPFLKHLAEHFDNPKFQDASKIAIIKPPNKYILYFHGKYRLFTLFERKWHKKFQIGKILNFIHVPCGTTMQNFNYSLQK